MGNLFYAPYSEFQRVNKLQVSTIEQAELFAALCRINTLYMITRAGSGHIGSSFSSMDIMSWLLSNEIGFKGKTNIVDSNIFFSSKGHDAPALYSILIGLGLMKFELIDKLRRIDGLPGHPDVSTPLMVTNTGSLGMGISKAKGMIRANRLSNNNDYVYVLTGDGELQEGQNWEALQQAANHRMHELVVIVDYNKIQSDTWVSRTSNLGHIEDKFRSFGWYVERCDGHDLEEFSMIIQRCKKICDRPKVIIADTVKGKGVSFMENISVGSEGHETDTLYRFHSGAPNHEIYSSALDELITAVNSKFLSIGERQLKLESGDFPERKLIENAERLVLRYSQELVKQAGQHLNIVALDADLMVDCGVLPFSQQYPERYFECGIAEQDMVSQAGGLALKGYLPIVHSFACFLSSRPNEHIFNNATEKTKIIYVGTLAGVVPGMTGHSHQSVRDISALAAIPGLTMIEPCNEVEVSQALACLINEISESSYLRLTSIPCQIPFCLPTDYKLECGKGIALTEGNDVILFGYGPVLLTEAFKAANLLMASYGIGLKVVNLPWLNKINGDWLHECVRGYKWIITLDNHFTIGGQGDIIISNLAEMGLLNTAMVKKIGISEIPVCGTNEEVLSFHKLNATDICQTIAAFMGVAK